MQQQTGLRIIFAGTPTFAAQHLQALLDSPSPHQVVAAYTQPDRPSGRGKKIRASPVKEIALEHNLPVYQPASLKSAEEQEQIAALDADIMVVVAYGLILPQVVLDATKLKCINVHASLLPRWRGAAPIQRAIEAGDSTTGITIMQVEAGLDTGPILLKRSCEILDSDTSTTLHDRLSEMGCAALLDVLTQFQTNPPIAEPQNNSQAIYAEKILKAEAFIDWKLSAEVIQKRIRAFVPFPVAYGLLKAHPDHSSQKDQRVKIFQSRVVDSPAQSAQTGSIIKIDDDKEGGIVVACGKQALLIQKIQLAGKSAMPVYQALLGNRELFTVGQTFASQPD